MTWQLIETAPKDGTEIPIFARWRDGSSIAAARWDKFANEPSWSAGYATSYLPEVVTHWMPLPDPPKAAVCQRGRG